MHGLHLLSLVFEAWKELELPFATTEDMTPVNYGFDRVRFTAPLRVGQRARARIVLDAVTKRDDGAYLVKATHTVEAEGSSKPCLVAEILLLFIPI